MVTSGSLGDEMVSTLAQNARCMTLIPALGAIFRIVITPPPPHTHTQHPTPNTHHTPAGSEGHTQIESGPFGS